MESLLQRLNERSSPHDQYGSSSNGSFPLTPATDEYNTATPNTEPGAVMVEAAELRKLQVELLQARNEVARINQELHSTHVAKSTVEHLGQSSETDYAYSEEVTEQTLTQLQNKFNAANRTNYTWGNESRPFYNAGAQQGGFPTMQAQARAPMPQQNYRARTNYLNEPTHFPLDQGFRGTSNPPSRPGTAFDTPMYNQYIAPPQIYTPYQPTPIGPVGPMGTRLSPEASEFSVNAAMGPSPWNSQVRFRHNFLELHMANIRRPKPQSDGGNGVQYMAPVEPMNYRRLLDRNMSCNWKYIVDKIICSNDQQASIFLQQKLKVGTPEQKYEIVEAIIAQAYPLMINRFGNFLVQRCFEHGSPEQVRYYLDIQFLILIFRLRLLLSPVLSVETHSRLAWIPSVAMSCKRLSTAFRRNTKPPWSTNSFDASQRQSFTDMPATSGRSSSNFDGAIRPHRSCVT